MAGTMNQRVKEQKYRFQANRTIKESAMESRQLSATDLIKLIEAPQQPNRQGFDPFSLEELMARFGVPGVSIAVIQDFEIHWAKGYGIADVETGAKVNPETLFQAASISKPVNAMAFLSAAEAGKLSMDND